MQRQQIEIPKIMLAGASAGITADILLHSMDTLKTRMQGQLTSNSIKYKRIFPSFKLILAQEGMQGLMAGFTPSVLGSLLATSFYFGCYETTKRNFGSTPISFFASGVIAETLASVFYVPSEVCKTRLQLQGKFNNPHSLSPHNYRNTLHAITSIYSKRGFKGLYSGWGATVMRDVPFSAIQFTIYETGKKYNELIAGALAGVAAGLMTTPFDVVKTYLQTQNKNLTINSKILSTTKVTTIYLDVGGALKGIYKSGGLRSLFSGVGLRMTWTGSQSMLMFFLYEFFLDLYYH